MVYSCCLILRFKDELLRNYLELDGVIREKMLYFKTQNSISVSNEEPYSIKICMVTLESQFPCPLI